MSNLTCDQKTTMLLDEQQKNFTSMQNSDDTSKALSEFITQTAEILGCDEECQKNNQSSDAWKKYEDAQMNMYNVTQNLEQTSDTYYTISKDDAYADKFREEKIRNVADKIGSEYSDVFEEVAETTSSLIRLYKTNTINYANSTKLHTIIDKDNHTTTRQIDNTENDVTTSDRKSYYEDQELQYLKTWNNAYYYIYLVILVVYFASMWLVDATIEFKYVVAVLATMILWGFFGKNFVVQFIEGIKGMVNWLPKNIYLYI